MTERMRVTFTGKSFPKGEPWMYFEPTGENLKILRSGFLGFDLPEGTTHDEALRIVAYLNEHISGVSYCDGRD